MRRSMLPGAIKRDGQSAFDALEDEADSLRTMDAQKLIPMELVHEEQRSGARRGSCACADPSPLH